MVWFMVFNATFNNISVMSWPLICIEYWKYCVGIVLIYVFIYYFNIV